MPRIARIARRTVLAATAATVLGCAVLEPPNSVTLGEPELQKLVDKSFPVDRRLLDVLDVSVSTPKVQLLADRNRIGTELTISTRDRLFGGSWQGRLQLDSALRWEASDQTVRLVRVQVHEFRLDGGGSMARSQAERLGAVLAEKVLEDSVLYRLPPERAAALQRQGVVPASLAVTRRGLEITFQPAAR